MKLKSILGWSSALCLSAMIAQAQETNQPADFNQQLKQMQESFEKRQQEMEKKFENMIAAQDAVIEQLKQQLASKPTNAPAPAITGVPPAETMTPEKLKELSDKVDSVVEAQKKLIPENLIRPSESWEKRCSAIAVAVRTRPAATAPEDLTSTNARWN